jgi:cell wall-associated NlpC family hydrolase
MTTRADVVAAALSWVGVPFHWQQSSRYGADCKGLVVGIARELGLPEAESVAAGISDYGSRVPVGALKAGLAETFERVAPEPGDILLMSFNGKAQHLGIHAGDMLIHTYNTGPRKVIATPLKVALRCWPLDSAWRFKSLED